MALNLLKSGVLETARVHLTDALGEKLYDEAGNAAEIEIFGKSSKQYKQALSTLNRKNIERKGKPQPYNTNVEDSIEVLVAVTKAAYNFDMGDGPLDTPAKFKALYSEPTLFFIKETVQEALEDNANFTQK